MLKTLLAVLLALFAVAAIAAVDANKATQAELETVKGIAPTMSASIIEARKAGAFKDWADMAGRVKGLGSKHAAKLSEGGLTVGGAAYSGGARAATAASKPVKAAKPKP